MNEVLPTEAYLAALAGLPAMGPVRLSAQLDARSPEEAWVSIVAGRAIQPAGRSGSALVDQWCAAASMVDVPALWEHHRNSQTAVLSPASAAFPERLREDPDPPAVLFVAGDPLRAAGRTAAIVGTRQCTRYGVDLAYELGALLSAAGVTVVSGLARGIVAAAHSGGLDVGGAAPVAVVASGVDVPYPKENRHLWARVVDDGMVCSEAPLGTSPERWRFPARNRIIAGLAEITIVIESHEKGGSLYTAAQAIERDRPVFAVPGSIRSAASMGCNRLVADGCLPLVEPHDVLLALGLTEVVTDTSAEVIVTEGDLLLLETIGWSPATFDEIVTGCGGVGVGDLAVRLDALVALGLLARRGPWFERTSLRPGVSGSNGPENPTLGARATHPES